VVILAGAQAGLHSKGGESAYAQYIKHLEKSSEIAQAVKKLGTVENFAADYLDFLQAPLQVSGAGTFVSIFSDFYF